LPKEGGGLAIEAYAVPRDAPHNDIAHDLLNFLLWPEVARRNVAAARLADPEAADQDEMLKRLSPQGAYDPRVAPLVQAEWERLVSGKTEGTPSSETGGQPPRQRVEAGSGKTPKGLRWRFAPSAQ